MAKQAHNNRRSQQDKSGRGKVKGVANNPNLGGGKVISQKFKEERIRKVIPLTAKNYNQKLALQAFSDKQMVILSGSAGVGKSELAVWWASKLWLEGAIDNIIITRPAEGLGRDGGAVPGSDSMKLLNYCMSMLTKFRKYLGPDILKNNLRLDDLDCLFKEKRGIQIVPLGKIQGLSFDDNTLVICDELQNSDVAQAKALTTRCEEGCQLIIAGDPKQSCKRGENGLSFIEKCLERYPTDYAEVIYFTSDDIERGGLASHMVKVFDEISDKWVD
jgi:phosphate starvation-inducible PhoH-like protein